MKITREFLVGGKEKKTYTCKAVNGLLFPTTISRHFLYFTMIEVIINTEAKNLLKSFKGSFAHYHEGGFKIWMVVIDNQFDCLTGALAEMQIQMTLLTKGEHEKFVKQNN